MGVDQLGAGRVEGNKYQCRFYGLDADLMQFWKVVPFSAKKVGEVNFETCRRTLSVIRAL